MDESQFSQYFLTEADMAALVRSIEEHETDDWERFLRYTEKLELPPGEALIRQFESGRDIFLLTAGELQVRVADARGEPEIVIARVTPFAIIGEQSFLDEGTRSATVAATETSTVHRLTFDAFDDLCTGDPDLAVAFLFDIARSLSLRERVNRA